MRFPDIFGVFATFRENIGEIEKSVILRDFQLNVSFNWENVFPGGLKYWKDEYAEIYK